MTTFELDPRLATNPLVLDWPLCSILLENDARFPWLVLVPRRAGVREIFDLHDQDRTQFYLEVTAATERLSTAMKPTKMNVAMLGNMVPQLHAHVIARFEGDAAWPGPVWGVGTRQSYEARVVIDRVAEIADMLGPMP